MRTGLAVVGAALLLFMGAVLTLGPFGDPEERSTEVTGISRVEISGASGNVQVRYRPGDTGVVHEKVSRNRWWSHDSQVHHRVENGTLVLDANCGWRCQVDYEVTLPAEVPVTGDLGSGDLRVSGMRSVQADVKSGSVELEDISGRVEVRASSGDIRLADVQGDVVVRTGSGEISGSDLRGRQLTAESGSGDVELAVSEAESVRVETGSGDIELTVPPGAYAVKSRTGSGEEEIEVPVDPNARQELLLSTGSGSIRVDNWED